VSFNFLYNLYRKLFIILKKKCNGKR